MKFKHLDHIELLEDIPSSDLKKGDTGTIVHEHTGPEEAYELEFVNERGETRAQIAVTPSQIKIHSSATMSTKDTEPSPHHCSLGIFRKIRQWMRHLTSSQKN